MVLRFILANVIHEEIVFSNLNGILTKSYQLWMMDFPQYRRYINRVSYFKIISSEEFYEYKNSLGKLEEYHFKAQILPDRNLIQDMLTDYHEHWEKIDEKTFKAFLEEG